MGSECQVRTRAKESGTGEEEVWKLQWGPQQWSGVSSGSGTWGWGLGVLMCTQTSSQMWKALICSWFLPCRSLGPWVSPSPELREGQAVVLSCHKYPQGSWRGPHTVGTGDGQPLQEFTSASVRFAAITLSCWRLLLPSPGSWLSYSRTWQPRSASMCLVSVLIPFVFLGEGGEPRA